MPPLILTSDEYRFIIDGRRNAERQLANLDSRRTELETQLAALEAERVTVVRRTNVLKGRLQGDIDDYERIHGKPEDRGGGPPQ